MNTFIVFVYRCSVAMRERECSDCSDGDCPQCYTRRDGSFFSKSRLSLQKLLLLMCLWARQYPVTDAMEEAVVDRCTVIDMYQRLQEVCTTNSWVVQLSGVVVQVALHSPSPLPMPLSCEISGALGLHLAQPGLTAGWLAGRQTIYMYRLIFKFQNWL